MKRYTRIHFFSYLRGIDGQLPGETQQKPDKAKHEGQSRRNEEDSENNDMHRPTGRNQYDYLLRLTRQIQNINEELRRNNKGEIKAIGVLGSDVYDKLLVLQAMRQQFLTAVFFTTDLDACLLQPGEFKWARNLIVASNFGLKLHDKLQGDIPAFRDNYQTSLFFSILLAFSKGENKPDQNFINKYLIPRIFEVGRNGAVDLTPTNCNQQSDIGSKLFISETPIGNIHPLTALCNTSFHPKNKDVIYLWLSIFLLLGLIYISSDTVKGFIKTYFLNYKNRYLMYITISVIVIGFVLWYVLKDRLFKEEPLSWFDGISIWPTEIIRFLSVLLSVFFLRKSNIDIDESNRDIVKHFNFPSVQYKFNISALVRSFLYGWGKNNDQKKENTCEGEKGKTHISPIAKFFPFWWDKVEGEDIGGKLDIHTLWQEYLKLGWFWFRLCRTAIFASCFFLLFFALFKTNVFSSLYTPARGDLSYTIDKIILIFAVIGLQFLLFFVVDATRLCRRFIRLISDLDPIWPEYQKSIEQKHQKIKLIAEGTETVCRLNYYPFFVLFLMIMARNPYFDRWNMSFLLLSIFVILGIYSLSCNIILHRESKRLKDKSIEELKEQLICLSEVGIKIKKDKEIEQIKLTIDAIESVRKGAFRPLLQQPMIRAALLPFGGAGSLVLIDYLTRW